MTTETPEARGSAYLKTLREAAGLSVLELADTVGVSRGSVLAWEKQSNPTEIKPDVEEILLNRIAEQRAAVEAAERLAERDGHLVLRRPRVEITGGRPVQDGRTTEIVAIVRQLGGRYDVRVEWED